MNIIDMPERNYRFLSNLQIRWHKGNTVNIDSVNEQQVVRGINEESIDDDDLVGRDTWKRICAVRGRNFNNVDPAAWQSLCARRGYLLSRANPRGF